MTAATRGAVHHIWRLHCPDAVMTHSVMMGAAYVVCVVLLHSSWYARAVHAADGMLGCRQHRAALQIQAAWRGRLARRKFLATRRGVVALQVR